MNGSISVESSPGHGSTFTCCIKDVEVTSCKLPTNINIQIDQFSFEKAHILIADDIPVNRELLSEFLSDMPFIIHEAENGYGVLDILKTHKIDAILMDMKMPEMDGYTCTAKIKDDPKYNSIPIIAVTASAMKEKEEQIRSICDAFIRKPVSRMDLISGLSQFLPHQILNSRQEEIDELEEWQYSKLYDCILKLTKMKDSIDASSQTMTINDLQKIFDQIVSITEDLKIKKINNWLESYIFNLQNFRMDELKLQLNNFNIFIDELTELCQSKT